MLWRQEVSLALHTVGGGSVPKVCFFFYQACSVVGFRNTFLIPPCLAESLLSAVDL